MTTILLDLKNKKLYADSRATTTTNSKLSFMARSKPVTNIDDSFTKIWPSKKFGRIYTGTGDVSVIERAIEKLDRGVKPKIKDDTVVWQIDSYPEFSNTSYDRTGIEITKPSECDFMVNGSGRDFASAALKALDFSDIERAFKVTFELDNGSDGKVRCYDVSGAPQWEDLE